MTWKSLSLLLALGTGSCRSVGPGNGRAISFATCQRADAIIFYHIGAVDKPIFPLLIGQTGRHYPLAELAGPYPAAYLRPHLVDSIFYVALAANIRRCLPATPQGLEHLGEFGTFSICLGQQQVFLGSQQEAANFFQALLPTLVPTAPAERALKAEFETMSKRVGQ